MLKSELLPVFVSAQPYARREPANAGDAVPAILDHALIVNGYSRFDVGARMLAVTAIRLYVHQLQALLSAHSHVAPGAGWDAMAEAERKAAQTLPYALTDTVNAIGKLLETEDERAAREEQETRAYMRDRLRTEAQLTPREDNDDGEAEAQAA